MSAKNLGHEQNHKINQKLNKKLRDKLHEEQGKFLLDHCQYFAAREEVLRVMEHFTLSDAQVRALMMEESPLDLLARKFMEVQNLVTQLAAMCIVCTAEDMAEELKELPVYLETADYATKHGEMDLFRRSKEVNFTCKEAIEEEIREKRRIRAVPDGACIKRVVDQFGWDRMFFILAHSIVGKDEDEKNISWAQSLIGEESNRIYVLNAFPGWLDQFTTLARQKYNDEFGSDYTSLP